MSLLRNLRDGHLALGLAACIIAGCGIAYWALYDTVHLTEIHDAAPLLASESDHSRKQPSPIDRIDVDTLGALLEHPDPNFRGTVEGLVIRRFLSSAGARASLVRDLRADDLDTKQRAIQAVKEVLGRRYETGLGRAVPTFVEELMSEQQRAGDLGLFPAENGANNREEDDEDEIEMEADLRRRQRRETVVVEDELGDVVVVEHRERRPTTDGHVPRPGTRRWATPNLPGPVP